ncbi:MAG: hypothetical protein FJW38_12475, partial [Acidobacteria bacterium]|nr:hypothetical protein [Acidobacteriota bacterium]
VGTRPSFHFAVPWLKAARLKGGGIRPGAAILKKVRPSGGLVQVIGNNVPDPRGGTWSKDGTILLGKGGVALHRISASGPQEAQPLVNERFDHVRVERWPRFLPDGRHFIYTDRSAVTSARGLYVGDLGGGPRKRLLDTLSSAVYVSPGYLLWADGSVLIGQAFDASRLELTGQPFAVAEGIGPSSAGELAVDVAENGTIVYSGNIENKGRLTWFDRSGKQTETPLPEVDNIDFRFSPDHSKLAASVLDAKTANIDIWITDLEKRSTSRFTSHAALDASPVWSPDGNRIIFRSNRGGRIELFQKSVTGGNSEETVVVSTAQQRGSGFNAVNLMATDWSPDGRFLIASAMTPEAVYGPALVPLSDRGELSSMKGAGKNLDYLHLNFSPDGRYLAYATQETGKLEVYVQTFPSADRKWKVSTTGGAEPRWRADGRELYYLAEDRKLMVVYVGAGPSFGTPVALFQTRVPLAADVYRTNYAPSRDGQRFLVNSRAGEPFPHPITVVLNWTTGLKR